MSTKFFTEIIMVGISIMVVGLIVSFISMGEKATTFNHWCNVAVTFFITGAVTHLIYESMGWNKWYCKHGNACRQIM